MKKVITLDKELNEEILNIIITKNDVKTILTAFAQAELTTMSEDIEFTEEMEELRDFLKDAIDKNF